MNATAAAANAPNRLEKAGPSPFDRIRTELAQKTSEDSQLPPPAAITDEQKAQMERALRSRLTGTGATNAGDFFRVDRKNTQLRIQALAGKVDNLPRTSAFSPVRDRLKLIETQFQNSGQLISTTDGMNPQSLLKLQMQMYQISENVEILSKVVDSVNSGVKTMIQVQV
jgi:hypothetical protein